MQATSYPVTYLTGTSNPAARAAARRRGDLGLLVTPATAFYLEHAIDYPVIAIDNGKFQRSRTFCPERFRSLLRKVSSSPELKSKVRFVVAPDEPFKAAETLEQFPQWSDEIRALGLPVAFAAQDGVENMEIPWDKIDVLFIGGSTDWKIGNFGDSFNGAWVRMFREAERRGIPIHMGRVNSGVRIDIAEYGLGCSTVDGTFLAYGPEKNLARLEAWLDRQNRRGDLGWTADEPEESEIPESYYPDEDAWQKELKAYERQQKKIAAQAEPIAPAAPAAPAPAADLNQRWTDGRPTYRKPAEPIRTAEYDVVEIPGDTLARDFVTTHHYSRTYPAARFRFGLYHRGELAGVAVYSHPCSNAVLTNVFAAPALSAVELGRFVLLDSVPGNGETWFLARTFEHLRQHGIVGVVSFSDPLPRHTGAGELLHMGHVGTIYQAHNGVYLGRGTARTLHMLPDGRVFSARAAQKIRSSEIGWRYAAEQLEGYGTTPAPEDPRDRTEWLGCALRSLTRKVRHKGNHKYAWPLTNAMRSHLPAGNPYPKALDRLH